MLKYPAAQPGILDIAELYKGHSAGGFSPGTPLAQGPEIAKQLFTHTHTHTHTVNPG